jgi:hypothetical protein
MGFVNGTRLLTQPNALLCTIVIEKYLLIGANHIPANLQNDSDLVAFSWIYDISDIVTNIYPL